MHIVRSLSRELETGNEERGLALITGEEILEATPQQAMSILESYLEEGEFSNTSRFVNLAKIQLLLLLSGHPEFITNYTFYNHTTPIRPDDKKPSNFITFTTSLGELNENLNDPFSEFLKGEIQNSDIAIPEENEQAPEDEKTYWIDFYSAIKKATNRRKISPKERSSQCHTFINQIRLMARTISSLDYPTRHLLNQNLPSLFTVDANGILQLKMIDNDGNLVFVIDLPKLISIGSAEIPIAA